MWRNLQYGVRQLRRNSLFSAFVILLLAIGIGSNTLVFSLVNELLLKPLPVRNPANLYLLEKNREKQVRPDVDFEFLEFRDLVRKSTMFAGAAAEEDLYEDSVFPLATGNGVRMVMTQIVSPNYFSELGIDAVAGRVLTPDDAASSATIPVVLSYQFWQSQFAGSRNVIGTSIRVKGAPFLVVGA